MHQPCRSSGAKKECNCVLRLASLPHHGGHFESSLCSIGEDSSKAKDKAEEENMTEVKETNAIETRNQVLEIVVWSV